jgi:hypothetical protein
LPQHSSAQQGTDLEATQRPEDPAADSELVPRGYPALAAFMGSDNDFFVFRKFNNLAARGLLYLQDELIELEEKLDLLDIEESRAGSQASLLNLHSRRQDRNQTRKELMQLITNKLQVYREAPIPP